jgi:hypothetical protein
MTYPKYFEMSTNGEVILIDENDSITNNDKQHLVITA